MFMIPRYSECLIACNPEVRVFRLADFFILLATFVTIFLAAFLWFHGHKVSGQFVMLWAPIILLLGMYIKLCLRTSKPR